MADLRQSLELPEKYYGDDIFVRWEGCDEHPLAKAEEAVEWRLHLIELLLSSASHQSIKRALAARLADCRIGRRCLSEACPECIRAHQRWFDPEDLASAQEAFGSVRLRFDHSDAMGRSGQGDDDRQDRPGSRADFVGDEVCWR